MWKRVAIFIFGEFVLWGLGEMLGNISPHFAAGLWIICSIILIIILSWKFTKSWTISKRHNEIKGKTANYTIRILPFITIGLLIYILAWSPLVLAFDNNNDSAYGINNAYIIQTIDPHHEEKQYPYSIMLEFGTRRVDTQANIAIFTNREYMLVGEKFDTPDLDYFTEGLAQPPSGAKAGVPISVGRLVEKEPISSTHTYQHFIEYPEITTNKSFYIYMESEYPLEIETVIYDGNIFQFKDGKFIIINGERK